MIDPSKTAFNASINNSQPGPPNIQPSGNRPNPPASLKTGPPLLKTVSPQLKAPTLMNSSNSNVDSNLTGSFREETSSSFNSHQLGASAKQPFTGPSTSVLNNDKQPSPSPLGLSSSQPRPQPFRPQIPPSKGPMKMPPKMPGGPEAANSAAGGDSNSTIDSCQLPEYCLPIYNTVTNGLKILENIDVKISTYLIYKHQ